MQTATLCTAASQEVGEGEGVRIANYLCNGNYAVSGGIPGCEAVERLAKPEYKARMTVRLAVAGAFHTHFMQPAVEKLRFAAPKHVQLRFHALSMHFPINCECLLF